MYTPTPMKIKAKEEKQDVVGRNKETFNYKIPDTFVKACGTN